MSWLFSRALVEAFSAADCSDGELSAQWKETPMPQGFSARAKTMARLNLSLSGQMFAPSTDARGEALLTWFREVSRARTSVSPAKEQGSTGLGPASGATWRASLAKFDPASSSWKTAQRSLLEDSDECSPTWPRSGTTVDGQCWELTISAPHISATASGLWPTPVSDDTGIRKKRYSQGGTPLSLAVTTWPTPTVCGNYNRKGASPTSGDGLATAVAKWPTPTSVSGNQVGRLDEWGGSRSREVMRTLVTATELGGSLNPTWVEWLMGWPLGWTDLRPLGTGRCHCAPRPHGEFSQEGALEHA